MKRFALNDNARVIFVSISTRLGQMALPLLPTVFRVAITHSGTDTAAKFTNVMHVNSAVLTPSQVLTALSGAAAVGMYDPSSAALNVCTAVITKLDNATPSIEGPLTGAGWFGTGAGEISPASSVVVTLKTSQRGRRHTGRVYIGGVTEDKIGNGQAATGVAATVAAGWTTFIANCVTAGVPLHVTSYGFDGVAPPVKPVRPAFAATTVLVEAATVGQILGTQRRRQSVLR